VLGSVGTAKHPNSLVDVFLGFDYIDQGVDLYSANEVASAVRYQRNQRLTGPLASWHDIFVDAKQVSWVPFGFNINEPLIVLSISGADAAIVLLLRQKVDIRPSCRKATHVFPRGTRPLDIGFVVFGLVPRRGDVYNARGVPIAHSGMILTEPI
jgi:hypothetical protein